MTDFPLVPAGRHPLSRQGPLAWWDRAVPPKYLHREEVHRVLERAKSPRDHLLANLLWQDGARISEQLVVRPLDFDRLNRRVRLKTYKTRRQTGANAAGSRKLIPDRHVPIKDALLGEVFDFAYRHKVAETDRLFTFGRGRAHQILSDMMLRAGVDPEKAHPHTLRHSFAVNCLMSGVPILVLQRWLGHASIFSTLVYLKVAEPDADPLFGRVEF